MGCSYNVLNDQTVRLDKETRTRSAERAAVESELAQLQRRMERLTVLFDEQRSTFPKLQAALAQDIVRPFRSLSLLSLSFSLLSCLLSP